MGVKKSYFGEFIVSSKPSLVVSDIGGTLVYGENSILEKTGEVFHKLIMQDIPVILITGFNFHTTKKYVSNLNKNIILMPQNGTLCIKNEKLIWEYLIEQDLIRQIYDFLEKKKLPVIVYKGFNENFTVFYKGRGIFQRDFPFQEMKNLSNFEGTTGISTILKYDDIDMVSKNIKEIIGDKLQMIRVKEEKYYWLEVSPKKVRKDFAIKRFCKDNDISLSDVIFFGDNYNDLELLRSVGYPVIVNNAIDEIKNEFKTVADSVYNEGVAKYLINLFNLDKNEK